MKLDLKAIQIIGVIHIILTVLLMGEGLPIHILILFGAIIGVARYYSFPKMIASFNKLYSWSIINENVVPTNDISGIDLGHYEFRETQKSTLRTLKTEERSVGKLFSVGMIYVLSIVFFKDVYASHPTKSIILLVYIGWELGGSFWSNYFYKHIASLGLIGLFCQFTGLISFAAFLLFSLTYFLLAKFYTQFFYEKLSIKKQISNFKINFPVKSYILFIISFIAIFILFPSPKSPFNFSNQTNKLKNLDNRNNQLSKKYNKNIKKHVNDHGINQNTLNKMLNKIPQGQAGKNLEKKISKYKELTKDLKGLANSNGSGDGAQTDGKSQQEIQQKYKEWKNLKNDLNIKIQNNGQKINLEGISRNLEKMDKRQLESLINQIQNNTNLPPKEQRDLTLKLENYLNNRGQNGASPDGLLDNLQGTARQQEQILKDLQDITNTLNNKPSRTNSSKMDWKKIEKQIKQMQQANKQTNKTIANKDLGKQKQIDQLKQDTADFQQEAEKLNHQLQSLKNEKNSPLSKDQSLKNKLENAHQNISKTLQELSQPLSLKNEIKEMDQNQLKELQNDMQNVSPDFKKEISQERKNSQSFEKFEKKQQEHELKEKILKNQQDIQINKKENTERLKKLFVNFTKIIGILILFAIFWIIKSFFKKDQIIDDEEVEQLDEKVKEEIKDLLSSTKTSFQSLEEEILYCYELFHEVINKLFYQPESDHHSPPPSILDDEESLLTKRLKSIAFTLANAYTPIKYGVKANQIAKPELKAFRNDFKDFIRLAKKLLRR
jgi:hypothetical protein